MYNKRNQSSFSMYILLVNGKDDESKILSIRILPATKKAYNL